MLYLRGKTYHWRKQINGQLISRSTKSSNKRDAERIAARWEAEMIEEVLVGGRKPTTLHKALDQHLKTQRSENARYRLEAFRVLGDRPLSSITVNDVESTLQAQRDAGAAHNTVALSQR